MKTLEKNRWKILLEKRKVEWNKTHLYPGKKHPVEVYSSKNCGVKQRFPPGKNKKLRTNPQVRFDCLT